MLPIVFVAAADFGRASLANEAANRSLTLVPISPTLKLQPHGLDEGQLVGRGERGFA